MAMKYQNREFVTKSVQIDKEQLKSIEKEMEEGSLTFSEWLHLKLKNTGTEYKSKVDSPPQLLAFKEALDQANESYLKLAKEVREMKKKSSPRYSDRNTHETIEALKELFQENNKHFSEQIGDFDAEITLLDNRLDELKRNISSKFVSHDYLKSRLEELAPESNDALEKLTDEFREFCHSQIADISRIKEWLQNLEESMPTENPLPLVEANIIAIKKLKEEVTDIKEDTLKRYLRPLVEKNAVDIKNVIKGLEEDVSTLPLIQENTVAIENIVKRFDALPVKEESLKPLVDDNQSQIDENKEQISLVKKSMAAKEHNLKKSVDSLNESHTETCKKIEILGESLKGISTEFNYRCTSILAQLPKKVWYNPFTWGL